MPFTVTTNNSTTELSFIERCGADDVIEVKDALVTALCEAPRLRFDTTKAEALDTASLQFALSAISTCEIFESADDPFLNKALDRWGISQLIIT